MHNIVPDYIIRPDYAYDPDGIPISEILRKKHYPNQIDILNENEINKIRRSCRIGRECLNEAAKALKIGISLNEIDKIVHDACIARFAYPSPMNYFTFPKSCCISVNNVICHGIPDNYRLKNGDIVNIDISVYYDGFHGDLSETYFIGNVDTQGRKLVQTTKRCLDEAIKAVKPGMPYKQLGNIIQHIAELDGFTVVRGYGGHGINTLFHTAPNIPQFANNHAIGIMQPGHVFTIEPMVNEGTCEEVKLQDNWTVVTQDGKRSAQFEDTLLVTNQGVEILTRL